MEVLKILFFAIVALSILVTFHEYGHYWVARKCGVKVLRFSIGFGKPLFRWQRGDTEFVIAGIPLGGYVKMFGDTTDNENISIEDQQQSFSHKTVWQRMAVVIAGPIANFLLAIVIYFLVFLGGTRGIAPVIGDVEAGSIAAEAGLPANSEIVSVDNSSVSSWAEVFEQLMTRIGETGELRITLSDRGSSDQTRYILPIDHWLADSEQPDFLDALGIVPFRPEYQPVVGQVVPDSPAEKAGLLVGDLILETAEKPITSWEQWRDIIRSSPEKMVTMFVERDNQIQTLQLLPASIEDNGEIVGQVGVAPQAPEWPEELLRDKHYGFFAAWSAAIAKTASSSLFIVDSLKKLINGQVSTKSLGGPVSIAKIAGASANAGWQAFLSFLAIMSVMLGIMNLLPIPMLDGGHLLFYVVEVIKGSPLSVTIQMAAMRIGMTIVFGIMLLALYNDFMRL